MLAHERASLPRSSLHAAAYLCLAWARLTPARLPDHPSRAAPPCPAGGARPEAQGGLPERRRPALKLRLGPRGLCLQRRVGRQRRRVRQLARRAAAGARRRPPPPIRAVPAAHFRPGHKPDGLRVTLSLSSDPEYAALCRTCITLDFQHACEGPTSVARGALHDGHWLLHVTGKSSGVGGRRSWRRCRPSSSACWTWCSPAAASSSPAVPVCTPSCRAPGGQAGCVSLLRAAAMLQARQHCLAGACSVPRRMRAAACVAATRYCSTANWGCTCWVNGECPRAACKPVPH